MTPPITNALETIEREVIDKIWKNAKLHEHQYTGHANKGCTQCKINNMLCIAIDAIREANQKENDENINI